MRRRWDGSCWGRRRSMATAGKATPRPSARASSSGPVRRRRLARRWPIYSAAAYSTSRRSALYSAMLRIPGRAAPSSTTVSRLALRTSALPPANSLRRTARGRSASITRKAFIPPVLVINTRAATSRSRHRCSPESPARPTALPRVAISTSWGRVGRRCRRSMHSVLRSI